MADYLVGHSRSDDSGKKYFQSLAEHSRNVAAICASNCCSAGLFELGYLIGLLHDMGKADRHRVQPHVKGEVSDKVNHASAGARYIWEKYGTHPQFSFRLAAQMAALSIMWHHTDRQDILSLAGEEKWLKSMHFKEADPFYQETVQSFFAECCTEEEIVQRMEKAAQEINRLRHIIQQCGMKKKKLVMIQYFLGMTQRFLFSSLIDADWTDTSCWMNQRPISKDLSDKERQRLWEQLENHTETFLSGLKTQHKIDRLREEISQQCFQSSVNHPGIYRLFVPTGGGKTYSGLRFAVHSANLQNADKVYYFAPYKSILSQNAKEFRAALGGEAYVLEHHSDIFINDQKQDQEEQEKQKLLMDRWHNIPFIATTMVQFLNTLFAAPRQNVRRMSALAHSVLIFDEVQALPLKDTFIFNLSINFLASILHCTIVLCTATQPALDEVKYPVFYSHPRDLVSDYEDRFKQFKRVQIVVQRIPGGYSASGIVDMVQKILEKEQSILIILNTKNAVNTVYTQLSAILDKDIKKYCLTTGLCVKHRKDVLDDIKTWQKAEFSHDTGHKLVCVSTQLIEAGVNISFDCVIRSMAGLTSVAQAAGRCNRNGDHACKNVYLINTEKELENLDHLPDIDYARQATEELLYRTPKGSDLLSPQSIQAYYHIYYRDEVSMTYEINLRGQGISSFHTSLLNLLSTNTEGRQNYFSHTGQKYSISEMRWQKNWKLCQAFESAEQSFEAISNDTVTLVVPYQKGGRDMIATLSSSHPGKWDTIVKELQPYTVEVQRGFLKGLEQHHAVIPVLEGTVLVLQEEFYDKEKGIQIQSKNAELLFQ